jgi:PAS domain S-box-containing protein/diguanylate cyclase (GGDEF)-like protein
MRAVARGEDRYEALVLHSTDIAVVFDSEGTILYVTPSMEAISGYRADELVGTQGFDFVHPDDLEADLDAVTTAISVGGSITREWRLCRGDGSWVWYEFTLTDLTEEPAIRGIVGHFRDVSARHSADDARHKSEMLFRKTVELTSDAILAVGPDGCITDWNPAATELFGWSAEDALGRDVANLLVPPEERTLYLERFRRTIDEELPDLLERPFEMMGMARDGRCFAVEVTVVQFELGGRSQLQALVRDIDARKQTEARLAGRGFTDPLTKLPNRALLHDRLTLALSRMARRPTKVSVMLLAVEPGAADEDGTVVKEDELILAVARRLSVAIRASDTVARYGDDQFVIVAEDLKDAAAAELIATRVIDTVSVPLPSEAGDIHPVPSIGIAWAESSGTAAADLLRDAYDAMGRARAAGGRRFSR